MNEYNSGMFRNIGIYIKEKSYQGLDYKALDSLIISLKKYSNEEQDYFNLINCFVLLLNTILYNIICIFVSNNMCVCMCVFSTSERPS